MKLASIGKRHQSSVLTFQKTFVSTSSQNLMTLHNFVFCVKFSFFWLLKLNKMTSTVIDEKLIVNLEYFNSTEKYSEGVVILLTLLENVIREPQNNKFRAIRLENKVIKEKLLCLHGIRELLVGIGFEEVCSDMKVSRYHSNNHFDY